MNMLFNKSNIVAVAACALLAASLPILSSCKGKAKKAAEDETVVEEAVEDLDAKYAADLLAKGAAAPEFTLQDPEGNEVSLKDFLGKYVVLDFWASWCPDCRNDVPTMKALWEKFGSDKVAFLGVSFDTEKEKWAGFVKENGMGWSQVSPLAKWKETQVSQDYNVNWIPSMYLIDPEGKVVFGTVMIDKLGKALEEIAK